MRLQYWRLTALHTKLLLTMNSKRRQLPLEVSTWMEKGLTIRKVTANSRLLTNDIRQNIVLSRQFFSNLLTLSYSRYRTMAQHDFDKKLFLKNQRRRVESTLPTFVPYLDHITTNSSRGTPSSIQTGIKRNNTFSCPSAQSIFSRSEVKSDLTHSKLSRAQSSVRNAKPTGPMKSDPNILPVLNSSAATEPQTPSRLKMSRERLNRLALPKGYRPKTANNNHVRAHVLEEQQPQMQTPEDIFGTVDHSTELVSQTVENLPEKPKSVADDNRFRELVSSFTKIYTVTASNENSVQDIVQANPSLQDDEGRWKMAHSSAISRQVEDDKRRQTLAGKLCSKFDVFLIDIGA